jgi:hypothetical protein
LIRAKIFQGRLRFYIAFFCLCSISTLSYSHEINIDGRLDDLSWESAEEYTKFYESFPFTLKSPTSFQKVLILEDSDGIYFGFINQQKKEQVRDNKHERDDEMSNADKVGVSIDFDGNGLVAYSFSVSAGGSISDGIYRNENEINYDWDADWKSEVYIDDDYWFAEIFIPWTIAPMKSIDGPSRPVKLNFWRLLASEWKVHSSIKGNARQEKYMSLFHEYEFNNYSISKIDFFPYLTLSDDRVLNEGSKKVGAEIFWKIDSGQQLNVAINPDFGQVESDELVVNFSSSETFYSDKRPFFSENHSLFDVKGMSFFYIVNTRRIGGAPDYDCSKYASVIEDYCKKSEVGINDIDHAIRYTLQNESLDFGFLGASEADENFSKGRDFYSFRVRKNFKDLTLGYLGTKTDRPILDRKADVHSFDFTYLPNDKTRIDTIYAFSDVSQNTLLNKKGEIFRFKYVNSPSQRTYYDIFINFFDEASDLNDMGYQRTDDYFFMGAKKGLKTNQFNDSSIFLFNQMEFGLGREANADFNKASDFLYITNRASFKNSSSLENIVFFRQSSKDYWITRGNPKYWYVKKPENYGTEIKFSGPSGDFFNYYLEYKRQKGQRFNGTALGLSDVYTARLDFAPRDNLNLSLMFNLVDENDWLNWLNDNFFGVYKKKQKTTVASINWFGGDKHELRLKAQMVGFTARDPQSYQSDLGGNLISADSSLDPFTLSDLAFQVRYRYKILPLAYLYVVYSRGGRIVEFDEENNIQEIYKRPWNHPQADTFTVKVRYRF